MSTQDNGHEDMGLPLLDRQIVAADGRLIGKVDDVAIAQDKDGHWYLTDLLVGPSALGPRFDGALGRWMTAVWTRLAPDPDRGPAKVPMDAVSGIGSAIDLTLSRQEAGIEGFEVWVREHLIERIPGHR